MSKALKETRPAKDETLREAFNMLRACELQMIRKSLRLATEMREDTQDLIKCISVVLNTRTYLIDKETKKC